ncbi:ABC transporter ATP-binding protein [Bacillus sp. M6-12]|uniref:ribosomal protection-like ABC-F family protein n=1 Tax=Bacillus sp. M6-12 TaxID=2054166 RepID=UPI000C7814F1|nr:ABC-F type ribosomal protection protein [Bacillus sp. M6-12]PLS16001.1 ABC transporter ATP-binding protein [Bacillus sp. M6-12]
MIVCGLQQISKNYGGNTIFENLSLEIHAGDRVGVVGRNGSGKTTFMKIIAGSETPDAGQVFIRKGLSIGYLSQIPEFDSAMTGRDVLMTAFAEIVNISEKMKQYEERMSVGVDENQLQSLLAEYGVLQEKFTLLDGYEVEAKVTKVANGLKINALLNCLFSSMSGGEKTKICLGLILLQTPELLLLDEPTNHLDISAVEWLEQFIRDYAGTVAVISHDRYFLDEVVKKVVDLEDGELTVYHQNYSGFVQEKEKRLLDEFQAYQEQQKKIRKMREAIKRLREWANRANPPSASLHKRATNMERALERMEKLKRPVLDRKKMELQFESADRSGKDVVFIKNASKSFGEKLLFQDASLHLQFKERAAIVGENGTGKSTILKMLLGEIPVEAGEVYLGSNVKAGYLSQHLYTAGSTQTVLEAFREEVNVAEGEARHILAGFLFYGPSVFRKVGQLSGGERMRLRLAQLMHQDINLLILDEPTNHLDIDSREVLEDALEDFQGTILAVSHDRYLLNKLFYKTFWLESAALHHIGGNYDYAKRKMAEIRAKQSEKQEAVLETVKVETKIKPAKKKNSDKASLEKIELQLEAIESEIGVISRNMEKEADLSQLQMNYERLSQLELRRDELYEQLVEAGEGQ